MHFTFAHPSLRIEKNDQLPVGSIAQLVQLSFLNCLSCVHNCDGVSSIKWIRDGRQNDNFLWNTAGQTYPVFTFHFRAFEDDKVDWMTSEDIL